MSHIKRQPLMSHSNRRPLINHINRRLLMSHINRQPLMSHINRQPLMSHINRRPLMSHINRQPLMSHINRRQQATFVTLDRGRSNYCSEPLYEGSRLVWGKWQLKIWQHLADIRWEIRDRQLLFGVCQGDISVPPLMPHPLST